MFLHEEIGPYPLHLMRNVLAFCIEGCTIRIQCPRLQPPGPRPQARSPEGPGRTPGLRHVISYIQNARELVFWSPRRGNPMSTPEDPGTAPGLRHVVSCQWFRDFALKCKPFALKNDFGKLRGSSLNQGEMQYHGQFT